MCYFQREYCTNDEQRMLDATTEIMRQLNALDVDTVRVVNAPKARMDSDDDLEEDGKTFADHQTSPFIYRR